MLKGVHDCGIFLDDRDRLDFCDRVADATRKFGSAVHLFCWMSNHAHLVIEIAQAPLHKTVHHFATRYAKSFNARHGREGHLFFRRHKAKLVLSNDYFISLLRYVHRNPVEAHLVRSAADYRWSSMRAYLGIETIPWLSTERALVMLQASFGDARRALVELVQQRDVAFDPWAPAPASTDRQHADTRGVGIEGPTLEDVLASACRRFVVTPAQLRSRTRSPDLTCARAWAALEAERSGAASAAAVARALGRSRSALHRAAKRLRASDDTAPGGAR
jgi:REP element-mobilizing transposase RayT